MITYFMALFLFGYFIIVNRSSLNLKLHFLVIILGAIISILSSNIYDFFNMQLRYEKLL